MPSEPCEIVTTDEIESTVGTGPVREGELTGNTCSSPVGAEKQAAAEALARLVIDRL